MRFASLLIVAALLPLGLVAEDTGPVRVELVESDRYLDAGDVPRDRRRNLELISGFLAEEVGACLAEGERAEIRVLDVDLAGRFEWWHHPSGVRVARDVDFPRMKLAWALFESGDEPVMQSQAWVSDPNFLRRSTQRSSGGPLAHEQRMIRAWAQDNFCREGS